MAKLVNSGMMANFMHHLDGFTVCPDSTVFLGVSMRVFLEEMSIWIVRLSRAHCSPQWWCISFRPLRTQKAKMQMKKGFIFLLPDHLSQYILFSCPRSWIYFICSPGSQDFGLGWNDTTGFPESIGCRRETVGLLSLLNAVSQFLIIHLHIYMSICIHRYRSCCPFLYGTPTNTDW